MEMGLVVTREGISSSANSMCKGTEAGSHGMQQCKCRVFGKGGIQPSVAPMHT